MKRKQVISAQVPFRTCDSFFHKGELFLERCLLIVNPTAGKERAAHYMDRFKQQLETMFDHVELKKTGKKGDATEWAREAALSGIDGVFCMGGDGTLNETINGLAQADNRNLRFGFVPLGTVNDLARALHIPLHPSEAIAMLKNSRLVNVDIGQANDRFFINTIAAGTLPEAVGHVSIEQKTRLGSVAYFLTGMKALQSQKEFLFKIETDQGTWIRRSPILAFMLTNSLGGFRNIAPEARVNDGKLWLGIFKAFTPLDILRITPELLAGSPLSSEFVTLQTIEEAHISILSGETLVTNVDGDEGPAFPLHIKVLPSFLSVYVPESAEL